MTMGMIRKAAFGAALAVAVGLSQTAAAVEWKTVDEKAYGYTFKIPKEFTLQGEEGATNTWLFQPGSTPAAAPAGGDAKEEKGKGKKIGGALGGLVGKKAKDEAPAAPAGGSSGGGLQPALTVYVNWTWMPDVDSGTMYSANKKGDKEKVDSPHPTYKDIQDFDKKKGYAYEGNTYWLKEVDKTKGDDIHRWHIHSFGNKSAYVVGLTGTYEQFKEWGPVFEEVVKSWALVPIQK